MELFIVGVFRSVMYNMIFLVKTCRFNSLFVAMTNETRPRKYYEITDLGKQALVEEQQQWAKVTSVLDSLWNVQPSTK